MFINSGFPWMADQGQFEQYINLLHHCGYQATLINLHNQKEYQAFIQSEFFPSFVPKMFPPITTASFLAYKTEKLPIPIFPRVTLNISQPNELKTQLSQWIGKRVIIAVQSMEKTVLEIAARDGRVDLLTFPTINHFNTLTKGILSLARQNRIFLDIQLSSLLTSTKSHRTRFLRSYYKLFKTAKPFSFRYIVGLGENIADSRGLWIRGPRELGAVLVSLLDLPECQVKTMLRENPESVVQQFIKRDLGLFIEPGVEIVQIKDARMKKNHKEQADNP